MWDVMTCKVSLLKRQHMNHNHATWKVSDKNEKRKYLFVRFNTQMYQCNFKSWQKNKSLFGEKQSLL